MKRNVNRSLAAVAVVSSVTWGLMASGEHISRSLASTPAATPAPRAQAANAKKTLPAKAALKAPAKPAAKKLPVAPVQPGSNSHNTYNIHNTYNYYGNARPAAKTVVAAKPVAKPATATAKTVAQPAAVAKPATAARAVYTPTTQNSLVTALPPAPAPAQYAQQAQQAQPVKAARPKLSKAQMATVGTSPTGSNQITAQVNKPAKPFSLEVIAGFASDMLDGAEPDHSISGELDIRPVIKIDDHWKVKAQVVLDQEFNKVSTVKAQDPVVAVQYVQPLSRDWKISPALSAIFPVSDTSREVNHLKIANKAALPIGFDFAKTGVEGLMQLNGYYQPSLTRYFNEGATGASGSLLNKYRFENKGVLNYTLGHSDFSLGLVGILASNWDYTGNVKNNDFITDESINWQATEKLGFGVGITNAGDVYKETGESNFAIVDPQNTLVYFQIDLVL